MNNRLIAALFVLVISALCLQAGTLNTLPMRPTAGTDITIEYKPSSDQVDWIASTSNLHAVVFGFTAGDDVPSATEVMLTSDGKRWSGSYKVPQDLVYAMIKVGDGRRYDTHRDLFWEVFVHTPQGKPAQSSEMRAALSWLGSLPQTCNRKADNLEAARLMQSEVDNYQRNVVALVNNIFLKVTTKQIQPQTAAQELSVVTQNHPRAGSPLEAIAIVQAYRQQGKTDDADAVIARAIKDYPNSRVAEQQSLDGMRLATSVEQLTAIVSRYLKQFPNSFARQDLINTVVTASTKEGKLVSLLSFFDAVEGVSAQSIHLATNYIGAHDSLRPQALELITRGLDAANDERLRPQYYGPSEWNEEQRVASSMLYFVQGAVQDAMGNPGEARASFEQALAVGGKQTDKGVYSRYATMLQAAGKTDDAFVVCEQAIQNGASDQVTLDMYRKIATTKGMDDPEVDAKLNSLRSEARSLIAERLSGERLNQPMIGGTFTDLNGTPVQIADWAGKVVILDYWATWCGPCRKSFPSMQKLYEKYKSNPQVQFAIVNVWERVDNPVKHVEEFLTKNPELTFPIFFDGTDVVRKYGVTGIPTKFFLGKDGRIQFKEVGYLPEEQFLIEATNKIEALLSLD